MIFELAAEQRMVQEQARRFAENEIMPTMEQDEKEHRFRPERVKQMGELGFFGCAIPEEYGGNGMGLFESVLMAEHQAAQLLVYRAAYLKDQGKPNQMQTSVAKLFASEAAVHAANEAMKIFGSYGFSTEYPIERYYRDVKSLQVVEGTSNIQKMIISGIACGHQPNR
jgi:alkylation response protein AidB-like acyl-CoA dehydrogenase